VTRRLPCQLEVAARQRLAPSRVDFSHLRVLEARPPALAEEMLAALEEGRDAPRPDDLEVGHSATAANGIAQPGVSPRECEREEVEAVVGMEVRYADTLDS
jgi:hypothetical protein